MFRQLKIILSVIGSLALLLSYLTPSVAMCDVTLSSPSTQLIDTPQFQVPIRADEILILTPLLQDQINALKKTSPLFGSRIEEDLYGIDWYLVSENSKMRIHPFAEVPISLIAFGKMSAAEKASFIMQSLFEFEFLLTRNRLKIEDSHQIISLVDALQNQAKTEVIKKLIAADPRLEQASSHWQYELVFSNNNVDTSSVILFSRKGIHFMVSQCEVPELQGLQAKGVQIRLSKIARSQNCHSLDHKLHTLTIRSTKIATSSSSSSSDGAPKANQPPNLLTRKGWKNAIDSLKSAGVVELLRIYMRAKVQGEVEKTGFLKEKLAQGYDEIKATYEKSRKSVNVIDVSAIGNTSLDVTELSINEYMLKLREQLSEMAEREYLKDIQLIGNAD